MRFLIDENLSSPRLAFRLRGAAARRSLGVMAADAKIEGKTNAGKEIGATSSKIQTPSRAVTGKPRSRLHFPCR
jgi:hypothetical protein